MNLYVYVDVHVILLIEIKERKFNTSHTYDYMLIGHT
jgi:hypothetical protein